MPETEPSLQLKSLIQRRGQVKGKLTRINTYFEQFTKDKNLLQLELRLPKLELCWTEFEEIQTNIELLDDTEEQLTERDLFEKQYFDLASAIKQFINENSSVSNISHVSPDSQPTIPVRLPTINLPTFSGRFDEWIPFMDSFQALIDKNSSLSPIQKLHYLKGALMGDAAIIIKHVELTASNYPVALDMLQDRYQNTRLIVQHHVKELFDLPQATRDAPTSLRQLETAVTTHIRSLNGLNINTDSWDPLMVHLISTKLDMTSYREWEMSIRPKELPSFNEIIEFIQRRSQMLENITESRPVKTSFISKPSTSRAHQGNSRVHISLSEPSCKVCQGQHAVYQCKVLLNSSHDERINKLRDAGICFNCLKPGHVTSQCRAGGCRKCDKKHNTMLHRESNPQKSGKGTGTHPSSPSNEGKVTVATSSNTSHSTQVLLSTALVDVVGPKGVMVTCRALLDSGSQSCFMTEAICQTLGLKKSKCATSITGISLSSSHALGMTLATIKSKSSNFKSQVEFLVLPKITSNLPSEKVNSSTWNIPKNIILADPNFSIPGNIDILIGHELFLDILHNKQIRQADMPTLQKTALGWIFGGRYSTTIDSKQQSACHLSIMDSVDRQIERFWKIEELPTRTRLTAEESSCEKHFSETFKRDETGRYIVKMPFSTSPDELGDSRPVAERRFLQVERKLTKNPELRTQYNSFIDEYISLGHMEAIKKEEEGCNAQYYLPHHAVLKETSTTTKLRVVFDASSKTSSGLSLNDILNVGPTVQEDLFSIILRFRMHIFVVTADIEKMYRQVLIDPSQRRLLQILWRSDPSEEMKTYKLNTVTYGTACAPYLATRVLKQLACDEEDRFPEASRTLQSDFYVDDLLSGSDSLQGCIEIQEQLISLLSLGGFTLRKWNSNHTELLKNLPSHFREREPHEFPVSSDASSKTLGLQWNPHEDTFQFRYTPSEVSNRITKRTVLSEIAKLFDPLGLVSPVVVRAKLFMQELWQQKIGWDEELPTQLKHKWFGFRKCMSVLNQVKVRRMAKQAAASGTYELHGFSDASERAFGAAVYLRHLNEDGTAYVSLLCSKSRVAPLKTLSIPRLELCAALLLAELARQVVQSIKINVHETVLWSDSTVVLNWISAEAATWNTFVANRVAKIQDLSTTSIWRHVRSEDNPADLTSRGVHADSLQNCRLWWNGPHWLSEQSHQWPNNNALFIEPHSMPELKNTTVANTAHSRKEPEHIIDSLIEGLSSFTRLTRVLAHCYRFIDNMKSSREERNSEGLTVHELDAATRKIIKHVQHEEFKDDYNSLSTNKIVNNNSKLKTLAPFLDAEGLIRVGGRINRSDLPHDSKHPIVLPKDHRISRMIARDEHLRQLHCGPQALLYAVRQKYWPINGRNMMKSVVHQCIKCFSSNPRGVSQVMGDLPSARVTQARPFTHTVVDFCGSFSIKMSRQRNSKLSKAYISVFVCMATKAVHLELVHELTTEAFLAAFRRFIARRGKPTNMYSDNGSNFIGADRQLSVLSDLFKSQLHKNAIVEEATTNGIQWFFNPPHSPHMGGLWEASVKSTKRHLRRVLGTANLSFEDFYTVLTQIEACLNSRPLTPMSSDPSDLNVLTPGHFLITGPLTAAPEPNLSHIPEGRLSRWQRLQHILQHFWSRWQKEYLSTLQQRHKWSRLSSNIEVGTLVLLREDNTSPLSWPRGRVTETHPGADGLVRVATVKTASGIFKRSVHKLCPLPLQE